MATISQLTARLVDLFGNPANAVPSKLMGNLQVSPNGNVLIGTSTDDGINKAQINGNLALVGAAGRIAGDFSNATYASRTMFQTSLVNGATSVGALPSGTGLLSLFTTWSKSDPTNAAFMQMSVQDASTAALSTGVTGTGTAVPLAFNVNAAERMRINTAGRLLIGQTTDDGSSLLQVNGNIKAGTIAATTGALYAYGWTAGNVNTGVLFLNQAGSRYLYYDGTKYSLPNAQLSLSTSANHIQMVNTNSGNFWNTGVDNNTSYTVFNSGNVGVWVGNGGTAWNANSDERLKNIRSEISGAIEGVQSIRTVRYSWKRDDDHAEALGVANDSRIYVGVIAQDVQKVVPEAVTEGVDGYLGVAYTELVPLALAAIKELSGKLDTALAEIAQMKKA
jgi:hypothetical protein